MESLLLSNLLYFIALAYVVVGMASAKATFRLSINVGRNRCLGCCVQNKNLSISPSEVIMHSVGKHFHTSFASSINRCCTSTSLCLFCAAYESIANVSMIRKTVLFIGLFRIYKLTKTCSYVSYDILRHADEKW